MECVNLEFSRRPLPLELLVEMHKCLPLADAINVLVNVPSFAFVDINKPRMLRTIQRIKTSLNEYIGILVGEEDEDELYSDDEEEEKNDPEKLEIGNEMIGHKIKWKPEMDAFLYYGSWLTSTRKLYIHNVDGGMGGNFVEKLLLHLANSSSTKMMLQTAAVKFPFWPQIPMPTFLKPLFNEKQFRIGSLRILFDSIELKADDGRTIYIHDGELLKYPYGDSRYKLRLFVQNKMNGNEWFKITMDLDYSKEFIQRLKFEQWKMQSFEDVKKFLQKFNTLCEEKDGGNTLEAKTNIYSNPNLDLFLRRGAKFTQFRHLKISPNPNQQHDYYLYCCPKDYFIFLINIISNSKHPEEFLESIDFDLVKECTSSIKKLWEICQKGIPKDGKFVKFDGKKLHILSAKTTTLNMEFTLANIPTNGEYLFDVCVEFGNELKEIVRIKIQKRKNDQIDELKCEYQIEKNQLGMKKKASNDDEDGDMPTCSNKIMNK